MTAVVGPLVLVVLTIFASSRARAEAEGAPTPERRHLVLPVTQHDQHLGRLARVAEKLERALRAEGLPVIPYREATSLFQQRHSREPRIVSREEVDTLLSDSLAATRAAADRRIDEVKQLVDRIQRRGVGALESLNRDDEAARAYFAACLAHIRSLVGGGERDKKAVEVARECQAAVPDLEPSPRENPPSVMRVFEELASAQSAAGLGTLLVESAPSGCRVLANGRLLGITPHRRNAPVGHRYAVQVECGDPRPGRVHSVVLGTTPTSLLVDTFFEHSVRTNRGALRLAYEVRDERSARSHAQEVARVLEADEVILLSTEDGVAVPLRALSRGTEAVLRGDEQPALRAAVDRLLRAPAEPATDPRPAAPPPTAATQPERRAWLLPTGAVLTGVGIALGLVGLNRYRAHVADGARFKDTSLDDYNDRSDAWRQSQPGPYLAVGFGAALASVGGVLLTEPVPPRHRRWLSPLIAAAGGGTLAIGVLEARRGGPCYSRGRDDATTCVDREHRLDKGALIAVSSAPLLITSIVHLAGWRPRRALSTLHVHASARSLAATLRF